MAFPGMFGMPGGSGGNAGVSEQEQATIKMVRLPFRWGWQERRFDKTFRCKLAWSHAL